MNINLNYQIFTLFFLKKINESTTNRFFFTDSWYNKDYSINE